MTPTPNSGSLWPGPAGASQGPGLPSVGRTIEIVHRYHTPSGQMREVHVQKATIEDPPGVFRTYELVEVIPPLACSCIPHDENDIAECSRCLSVVCASKHSGTCHACGRVYCTGCLSVLEVPDTNTGKSKEVRLCKGCEAEARELPILKVLRRSLWG
jgi:FYVE zinc finger